MTFSLENAIVYDLESFPNIFSIHAEGLFTEFSSTWEISTFRDDRHYLFTWLNYINQTQTPMIGFNSLFYDYPLLHWIYKNPKCTVQQIYQKSKSIIDSKDRFAHLIWPRDRFAPQIDLFRVFHFDNKAKTTNLKALQINMRSESVVESAVPFDTEATQEQVNNDIIPYNKHDVKETKKFALGVLNAIQFRIDQIPQFGVDVLNWNDTKIGENILIDKIGRDVCMPKDASGRRTKRQTIRTSIALRDVIFPYIKFETPEFRRVLEYMREQVLKPEEFLDVETGEVSIGDTIKTKGVFSGLKAHVAGLDYHFGTGGIHASVSAQHVQAGNGLIIRDIDVASLYPSVSIENNVEPEHLKGRFANAYRELRAERQRWQKEKGKKCTEANAIKLALNGAYGKSNDKFSVLFDPQFTMTITINGQLLLAMLAEWLLAVPALQMIMANTDGLTFRVHQDYLPTVEHIEKQWENYTHLVLESAHYKQMWIADVNNYIAEYEDE